MLRGMEPRPWTVLPHGQIEQLETNLWRVEASLKSPPLERVMTIAKLSTGGLVLHSVIALDDVQMTVASRKKVEQVVKVDGTIDELVDSDVVLGVVEGTRGLEAMMTVTSGDRVTLVFTDVIFNMPHKTGLQGFVLRHVLDSSGGPKVTRLGRTFLIKDKQAFAAQLEQLAAQNVTRIVVAHNEVISVDPAGVLRGIAASMR